MRALAMPKSLPGADDLGVELYCPCFHAQGLVLESGADNGYPRIGNVDPDSISGDLLIEGDVVMAINGTTATSHSQAAKMISECTGDIVLKVLAKKPRSKGRSFFGKKKSKSDLVSHLFPILA